MSAFGGDSRDVVEEVRVCRWWCVRGGGGRVGPLEGWGRGGCTFVLGLDEISKGVMVVDDVLFCIRRERVGLRMIGFEVGGSKRAGEMKVNATSAGIIVAFVNEMEAFARRRSHSLLFVVGSGLELLLGPNSWSNLTWCVWLVSAFEVSFSGWGGDGCRP